jgi:hypothetical protein
MRRSGAALARSNVPSSTHCNAERDGDPFRSIGVAKTITEIVATTPRTTEVHRLQTASSAALSRIGGHRDISMIKLRFRVLDFPRERLRGSLASFCFQNASQSPP